MDITSKEVFNLDELVFEMVIDALNKYFANNKRDTSFIEVRKNSVVYRLSADNLIAWLRTKHGIFYYPDMEAKYAKAEKRIPPFSERLMDEGALNSLKKLHKQVTGEEPEVDSHTLIANGISHAVSVKDVQIEELKTHIDLLQKDIWDSDKKTIKKDLCDILEALGVSRSHTLHLSTHELKTKAILRASVVKSEHDRYLEQLDKATADYQALCEENQKLKEVNASHPSDINQLISDFCAKNDVTPPAPYFSDEESIKYLFSVVDLERRHRAAVGKQMVDDYEKDIMNHIRQEASRNWYTLPEKVDGEPLTIERVFHDLLELMRIRGEELRILKSKCYRLNEIVEELNTLNNEIKE